jgi:hypothetical protein
MDQLYTIKKNRALQFLNLKYEDPELTIRDLAILLQSPLSTVQKHDNSLKRLVGYLGESTKDFAFKSLDLYDKGLSQVNSVTYLTDHKMVSDLVAMRWAINEWAEIEFKRIEVEEDRKALAEAAANKITIESSVIELRVRNKFRGPINTVTESLDELLALSCIDERPEYDTALSELTEAIIELEDTLMS